jgi:uncharacterized protein (TIGR04551 family)
MIRRRYLGGVLAWALVLVPLAARAQTPPGGPGGPPGGTIGEEENKPEGAAEKAPKEANALPTLPPLPPYPGQPAKKFQLLELNGYMRLRTMWANNWNLGFKNTGGIGVPFPEALTCMATAPAAVASSCSSNIDSADMRVRLEPTIHLSEYVSLHMQVDLFDNLELGSTPDGLVLNGFSSPANIPTSAFSPGQAPQQAGRNAFTDAIQLKQAWGEVKNPTLGVLRFGRQPSHWGLGILANSGGYDPFHGTVCTDCDYGTTVDRIMIGSQIPNTQIKVGAAVDWAAVGATSQNTSLMANRYFGQPFDLDDSDDVNQYVLFALHIDDPGEWAKLVKIGDFAANYGAYFVYRQQTNQTNITNLGDTPENAAATIVKRGAHAYIPDLWGRLAYKNFTFEGEALMILGTIDNLSDLVKNLVNQKLLEIGAVGKMDYALLNNDMHIGLEVGYASGDQWEGTNQGATNVNTTPFIPQDPTDTTISNFMFNPDYHTDLILFRQLIGTVTNATYIKPTFSYNLTPRFKISAQGEIAFANVPVATPGNSSLYGIELDGDFGYNNEREGFFAGISYGVLFPFGALSRPSEIFGPNSGDPSTAQTIQGRLVLKF